MTDTFDYHRSRRDGFAVWHEHHFSPLVDIDVDDCIGRFDAVEDDTGAIFVLDVGADQLIAQCSTREEASLIAKDAANAYSEENLRCISD